MHQYKCVYRVNNQRTEEIISARDQSGAKKIIEAKYAGAKISWISCTRI